MRNDILEQAQAIRNSMEYTYGKYYLDPEDSKTYLCKRGEETGSIVLYYLPHELIGQYFEEVS